MFSPFVIQTIGYIAISLGFLTYVIKSDTRLLQVNTLFVGFMGIHLFLLGGTSGAFTLFFDGIKGLTSIRFKKNYFVLGLFTLANIAIIVYTFDGRLISLLPAVASISWTAGVFLLSGLRLRFLFIFVILNWAIYNCYVFTIPGMIGSFVNLTAVTIGTIRILLSKDRNYAK